MKTRIIASYLIKEGFFDGDRDVDLDEYQEAEVKTLEEGRKLIAKNDLFGNGIGTITEEVETEWGWEDTVKHDVSEGAIYQSTQFLEL